MKILRRFAKKLGFHFYWETKTIEWNLPGSDLSKWIEIELAGWGIEISYREIYDVAPEHQRVLGKTDSRTVWAIEIHFVGIAIGFLLGWFLVRGL